MIFGLHSPPTAPAAEAASGEGARHCTSNAREGSPDAKTLRAHLIARRVLRVCDGSGRAGRVVTIIENAVLSSVGATIDLPAIDVRLLSEVSLLGNPRPPAVMAAWSSSSSSVPCRDCLAIYKVPSCSFERPTFLVAARQ